MSSIKVANVRDTSGTTGLTMNGNNTVEIAGERLVIDNLVLNGSVSGAGGAEYFLPSQDTHAGKILQTDGSTLSWLSNLSGGENITSMQVFTSSGTWSKPAGVRFIKVQVVAGGGGGSGHGEAGGAGGYTEKIIDVGNISSVYVTISGESNGSYYFSIGGRGGSSSFGNYCSASGGYGANANAAHCGGVSGTGSGGDLNIYGGGGQSHHSYSGWGGASYFGGAVAAGHPNGGNFSHNHQSHCPPGTGGAGGYFHGHRGSNGRPGLCVITHFK